MERRASKSFGGSRVEKKKVEEEEKTPSLSQRKKTATGERGIVLPPLPPLLLVVSSSLPLQASFFLARRGVKMAAAALPRRIIKETQRFLTDTGENELLFARGGRAARRFFLFRDAISPLPFFCSRPFFFPLSRLSPLFQIPVPGIKAEPDEQNLRYFKVEIDGPTNTPYEGE